MMLWLGLSFPGYLGIDWLNDLVSSLHRGGRRDQLFRLLDARLHFRCGRIGPAREALEAARGAEVQWRHLPLNLLNDLVAREKDFLEMRASMARGEFDAAATAASELGPGWFDGDRAEYYRGVCLLRAHKPEAARQVLEPLAEDGSCDAMAALARLCTIEDAPEEAERWADGSLEVSPPSVVRDVFLDEAPESCPLHPLAMLVKAELEEARGEDEAAERRLRVAGMGENVPPLLRATARLGLGRRAEQHDRTEEAEANYRKAMTVAPDMPAPRNRLVCLLAGRQDGEASGQEAMRVLETMPESDRSLPALVAAALVAERSGTPQELADRLASIINHPDYSSMDESFSVSLSKWSIHAQLQLERYEQAADATRALLRTEDTPELRGLLVDCRMLSVTRMLREQGAGADVLRKVESAVEEVLEQRPDHQVALLIAATVRVLKGQAPVQEHTVLVERLEGAEFDVPEVQMLVELNRLFTNTGARERVEDLVQKSGLDEEESLYMRLLAANQSGDVKALQELWDDAVPAALEAGWSLPMKPANLASVLARREVLANRLPRGEEILRVLDDPGLHDEESLTMLAVILVHRGIGALGAGRILEARDLLDEAREKVRAFAEEGGN
jgi:tetratricopeptide (TPR) repeat protein